MKIKFLYFIVILLCYNSCKQDSKSEQIETRIYSYTKDYDKSKIAEIDLDSIDLDFRKTIRLINKNISNGYVPVIVFNDSLIRKKVIPFDGMPHYQKTRNLLRITEDSMLWQFKNPMILLPDALKLHYENNGNNVRFSENSQKAVIEITIDTSASPKILKKTLSLVTKEFDKINGRHYDSLNLKLYFSILRQMPPPPPPTKATSIIKVEN